MLIGLEINYRHIQKQRVVAAKYRAPQTHTNTHDSHHWTTYSDTWSHGCNSDVNYIHTYTHTAHEAHSCVHTRPRHMYTHNKVLIRWQKSDRMRYTTHTTTEGRSYTSRAPRHTLQSQSDTRRELTVICNSR